MTRRDFGASLILGSTTINQTACPKNHLNIGLQSFVLRNFPFEKAIEIINKLSIRYLETYNDHLPFDSYLDHLRQIKKILAENRIKLMAFGVIGFDHNFNRSRSIFRFAKEMGLYSLSADPEDGTLNMLELLSEEYGIKIAIHPHGPDHPRWRGWKSVYEAVNNKGKNLGICLDTGHVVRNGEDPAEAIDVMSKRIFGVHLKDADKNGDVPFGRGMVDIRMVLEKLSNITYKGIVSIECEMNPDNPIPDIEHSLNYVKSLGIVI